MRHGNVLQFDAGHLLVDAFKQGQERVVIKFLVVVTFDLVEPQLDVGRLGRDGVDVSECPAGEVALRLAGIDRLRATGLLDREPGRR